MINLKQLLDANIATDEEVSELCFDNWTTFTSATKSQQERIKDLAEKWEVEYDTDEQFCQELSEEGVGIIIEKGGER